MKKIFYIREDIQGGKTKQLVDWYLDGVKYYRLNNPDLPLSHYDNIDDAYTETTYDKDYSKTKSTRCIVVATDNEKRNLLQTYDFLTYQDVETLYTLENTENARFWKREFGFDNIDLMFQMQLEKLLHNSKIGAFSCSTNGILSNSFFLDNYDILNKQSESYNDKLKRCETKGDFMALVQECDPNCLEIEALEKFAEDNPSEEAKQLLDKVKFGKNEIKRKQQNTIPTKKEIIERIEKAKPGSYEIMTARQKLFTVGIQMDAEKWYLKQYDEKARSVFEELPDVSGVLKSVYISGILCGEEYSSKYTFEEFQNINEVELNCIFAETGADKELDFDREKSELDFYENKDLYSIIYKQLEYSLKERLLDYYESI